jgi:S-adenosylmethionine:tRNA ribosyltransferase-isomerase
LLTRDFDYALPSAAIAQQPAPRGTSRLLVLDQEGAERHRRVGDLPVLLRRGDLLVVNDTRVLAARLFGRSTAAATGGGGRVELLLAERQGEREWDVLCRPGRRARLGAVIELETRAGDAAGVAAEVTAVRADGRRRVRFSAEIESQLERLGHVPLPPYIRRGDEPADDERYQTVFASRPGAIAAPTAGLHFSPRLLAELAAGGVERAALTLHVGIGTFKPVTAPLVSEHRMEGERFAIPPETAAAVAAARAGGRRVVAVGTTVVRTLEAAAARGGGTVEPGAGSTDLFITPGFRFQAVDALLTNFHLPCSTLLMLVSAFAGRERVLAAYREALRLGYRFFSYGDAMLAERRDEGI